MISENREVVTARGEDWSILSSNFGAFSPALVKGAAKEVAKGGLEGRGYSASRTSVWRSDVVSRQSVALTAEWRRYEFNPPR